MFSEKEIERLRFLYETKGEPKEFSSTHSV